MLPNLNKWITLADIDFFRLNTLIGTAKAPLVDIFRLNTLRGTKLAWYDEHPCLCCVGAPWVGAPWVISLTFASNLPKKTKERTWSRGCFNPKQVQNNIQIKSFQKPCNVIQDKVISSSYNCPSWFLASENADTCHGLRGIQQPLRIHSPWFLSSIKLKITKQSRRCSRVLWILQTVWLWFLFC